MFTVIVIVVLLALALVAWLIFGSKNKPTEIVIDPKQASAYSTLLQQHIDYYQKLNDTDKARFESRIAAFLSDTNIEGVGTEITDLDRVMIASSAVIPVFRFPDWRYHNLTNVILYPDTFDSEFQFEGGSRNIMGMVGSGYMNGQMLLSRQALTHGFSANNGKENTGIHEFVHLLDKTDGATDGVPENLMPPEYAEPWLKMMHQEMHRIQSGKSDINPYALTNEAEFLAVAAEYFFEKPEQLQDKHPEIYAQLSMIFGQDPASPEDILK
jgi:Mlc titration factor MtfA (ptsG expression regulator)